MRTAFVRIGVFIVMGICIYLTRRYNDKQLPEEMKKDHHIIRWPKAFKWTMAIVMLGFIGGEILLIYKAGMEVAFDWPWVTLLSILLSGSFFMFLFLAVYKVESFDNEDYFIHTTMFGRKTIYRLEDIKYFVEKDNEMIIHFKHTKKKVYVNFFNNAAFYFLKQLNMRNLKKNNSKK